RSGTVPVLQADNRPIRVKPENPGGMQVSGLNEDILSGTTESKEGKLAPPPEAPAPQALRAPPPAPPAPAAAPAAVQPVVAKPARAKPVAEPEKRQAVAPQTGKTAVQLAAVRSEDAAKAEWQRLSTRMPDLFGARKPSFNKTERDGQTLWRVRTG